MNVTLAFVASDGPETFQELDTVRLRCSLRTREEIVLPAGTCGTIVAVWGGGAAYEVEFGDAPDRLMTVEAADLELVGHQRR